jgi:methylenetetrahydrofolate reductase (NADPH)
VGAGRDEIAEVLAQLREGDIENVLPLRGDPPAGEARFVRPAGGFGYASELIAFIRGRHPSFCIAAACYPEKHIESPDPETDLANLKTKVNAGVDFLITQLFFDNRDYFSFIERARKARIEQKIIAGIMPITNLGQIKRFTAMCGAKIPAPLLQRLEETGGEPEAVRRIGVAHAIEQCCELLAGGAPGIHFYTLNRSQATVQVLEALRGGRTAHS